MRKLQSLDVNYDIVTDYDFLSMNIGPSVSDQSDSKNERANQNLQVSSKNMAENPNNYQFVKFLRVLASAEIFVYIFPCLQLPFLLLMLSTPLPPNFYNLARFMASFIHPGIPDWEVDVDKSMVNFYGKTYQDTGDMPKRIRRLNISSSSLCNLEYIYLILFLAILTKFTLGFFNNISQQKNLTVSKITNVIQRFIWYYVEANFTLILTSLFIDLSTTDFGIGFVKYLSFMFSILLVAVIGGLLIYIQGRLRKSDPTPEFKQEFCFYFDDIQPDKKAKTYYHHVNYMKKIATIFILVFIQDSFGAQVWLIVILNLGYSIYTYALQPHREKVVTGLVIAAEFVLIIALIIIFSADEYIKDMFKNQVFSHGQLSKLYGFGWAIFPFFIIHQAIYGCIGIYNSYRSYKLVFEQPPSQAQAPQDLKTELSPRSAQMNQDKKITPQAIPQNRNDLERIKQSMAGQIPLQSSRSVNDANN